MKWRRARDSNSHGVFALPVFGTGALPVGAEDSPPTASVVARWSVHLRELRRPRNRTVARVGRVTSRGIEPRSLASAERYDRTSSLVGWWCRLREFEPASPGYVGRRLAAWTNAGWCQPAESNRLVPLKRRAHGRSCHAGYDETVRCVGRGTRTSTDLRPSTAGLSDYPTTPNGGDRPDSNRDRRATAFRAAVYTTATREGGPLASGRVTDGVVAGEGIEPPCAVCRTAVLPLNEPAVGRGGRNRTRMARLMRPPRSPSLPSATETPMSILSERADVCRLRHEPTWMVPPGGLEPPLHGLRARRAALTLRERDEWSEWRIRTRTSRLGRPAGNRYPTFASGSALRDRLVDTTPNSGPVRSPAFDIRQLSKTPLVVDAWCGDSARIRTRTHEVWRLGCFRYTTLSLSSHLDRSVDTALPPTWPGLSAVLRPKTKKAF